MEVMGHFKGKAGNFGPVEELFSFLLLRRSRWELSFLTMASDASSSASEPVAGLRRHPLARDIEAAAKSRFIRRLGSADKARSIVIGARGTSTRHDWATDANSLRVAAGLCGEGLVHMGFKTVFDSFISDLEAAVDGCMNFNALYPPEMRLIGDQPIAPWDLKQHTTVYIAGHSLGAALATLCAGYFKKKGYQVVVYTIASPRVGNKRFASWFNAEIASQYIEPARSLGSWRMAIRSDPVTHVPSVGYKHVDNNWLLGGWYTINPVKHKGGGYAKRIREMGSADCVYKGDIGPFDGIDQLRILATTFISLRGYRSVDNRQPWVADKGQKVMTPDEWKRASAAGWTRRSGLTKAIDDAIDGYGKLVNPIIVRGAAQYDSLEEADAYMDQRAEAFNTLKTAVDAYLKAKAPKASTSARLEKILPLKSLVDAEEKALDVAAQIFARDFEASFMQRPD